MNKAKMRMLLVALLISCAICKAQSQGAGDIGNSLQLSSIEGMMSTNHNERLESVKLLNQQRQKLVQGLISILDGTNSRESKIDAIIVCGDYKVDESVAFIVQHIQWDGSGIVRHPTYESDNLLEHGAPCFNALLKIGMPAIPKLLQRITDESDPIILGKCVNLCQAIEDPDVIRYRLKLMLDTENNQTRKDNIQRALDNIDAMKKVLRQEMPRFQDKSN